MSKGPLKRDFLHNYVTTFLGVRNFGNTSAVRVIFLSKCSKFHLNFKNAKKKKKKKCQKAFSFSDNSIWIGSVRLCLFRREYLSSAVNVLANSPKILHTTKTITFRVINKYGKGSAVQIATVFRLAHHVALRFVL